MTSPVENVAQGERKRPISPWLQLCPPGTVELDLRFGPVGAAQLSPDGPVVLLDQRARSRRRLRRTARELGVVLEREFVVLPTLDRPMVVVDDVEEAIKYFWTAVATVPPGFAFALPASACLGLARLAPWRWTGALAPARVVVGRRR
ncbi:hypothetical protein EV651_12244 [Kribbella sp. VKM Ac-2571]|uniref:hypothetical protein n=1 Tax=Kribbella sp. VKM Ac-2571 TaxID=2512222 RepID=UPI00105FC0C8|nr:hypothetical protein [Kribbella sp. VKM Ac-2571]TDO48920.1 hypothetical protein EV651_12244 [Kribbella sp. VKM Ac-2571]